MHVVENTEGLKYAISTGIKWPIATPLSPSSGLAHGRFKTQKPALQTGILDPSLAKAAGAKTQSRGTPSPSPPRRRGSRLDSRLRGNDGRCCFPAFTARLKPGPVTRRPEELRKSPAVVIPSSLAVIPSAAKNLLFFSAGNKADSSPPAAAQNDGRRVRRLARRLTGYSGACYTIGFLLGSWAD